MINNTLYVRRDRGVPFYVDLAASFRRHHQHWHVQATGVVAMGRACELVACLLQNEGRTNYGLVSWTCWQHETGSSCRWDFVAGAPSVTSDLRNEPVVGGFYVCSESKSHPADQAAALLRELRRRPTLRIAACGSALGVACSLIGTLGLPVKRVSLVRSPTLPSAQSVQTYLHLIVSTVNDGIQQAAADTESILHIQEAAAEAGPKHRLRGGVAPQSGEDAAHDGEEALPQPSIVE